MAAVAAAAPGPLRVEVARDADVWDATVASRPDATFYHRWGWRRILADIVGHPARYLVARAGDRVIGALPMVEFRSRLFGRFAVSLPFVNYGGILADDQTTADALVESAVEWARDRQLAHVELRHLARRAPAWPERRHKVTMRLALEAAVDRQWSALDRKVRNLVRKAEKCGLSVEEGGQELLRDFYRVFAHNMRDLGTPVQHRRFFEAVLREFSAEARIFVVRLGAEAIAASLTVSHRGSMEVPWASSLRAHADKAPNMLLYWTMLKAAIAGGHRTFDFGRSTPSEGTYRFKEQWGAKPLPLVWEYAGLHGAVPDLSPANPKFRLAIAMWQRLPVSVATRLGPPIVRNLP